MVIRLSPTLQKRVTRAAQAQGITPEKLVSAALKQYLAPPKSSATEEISESRRRLRELARYKKPVLDFDAAVHRAKELAHQSYEDNADLLELAAQRFKSHDSATK